MSLVLDGVTLERGGRTVLREASLSVEPGELVCLLGRNGAGKSTALGVAGGDHVPAHGRVELEGTPLAHISPTALARRRGYLTQGATATLPFLAVELVALGRLPHGGDPARPESLAIARAALGVLEAADLADRPYTELSGGERQRVQVARILAQVWPPARRRGAPPSYVLLDEPVAHLDLAHAALVLDVLAELARGGAGVLVVLHDLGAAARVADRVVLLAGGRVRAAGTPAEAITSCTVREVFGADASIFESPVDGRPIVVTGPSRGTLREVLT